MSIERKFTLALSQQKKTFELLNEHSLNEEFVLEYDSQIRLRTEFILKQTNLAQFLVVLHIIAWEKKKKIFHSVFRVIKKN